MKREIYNAIRKNDMESLKAVFAFGANPNEGIGVFPLLQAAEVRNLQATKILLEQPEIDIEQIGGPHKCSTLHYACSFPHGRKRIIKKLLEAGADSSREFGNANAMITLIKSSKNSMIIPLISLMMKNGTNINATDELGRSALSHAVLKNDPALVKFLLAFGAPSCQKDKFGQDPKELAFREKNFKILEILLKSTVESKFSKTYHIKETENCPYL